VTPPVGCTFTSYTARYGRGQSSTFHSRHHIGFHRRMGYFNLFILIAFPAIMPNSCPRSCAVKNFQPRERRRYMKLRTSFGPRGPWRWPCCHRAKRQPLFGDAHRWMRGPLFEFAAVAEETNGTWKLTVFAVGSCCRGRLPCKARVMRGTSDYRGRTPVRTGPCQNLIGNFASRIPLIDGMPCLDEFASPNEAARASGKRMGVVFGLGRFRSSQYLHDVHRPVAT